MSFVFFVLFSFVLIIVGIVVFLFIDGNSDLSKFIGVALVIAGMWFLGVGFGVGNTKCPYDLSNKRLYYFLGSVRTESRVVVVLGYPGGSEKVFSIDHGQAESLTEISHGDPVVPVFDEKGYFKGLKTLKK